MYIKKVRIKNYKCFEDETIELNIPDNKNIGSGLTILVGENNSGKSTFINIFSKLKPNSIITSSERRGEKDVEIIFTDDTGSTRIVKNKSGSALIDNDDRGESTFGLNNFDLIKDNKIWVGKAGSDEGYSHNNYRLQADFNRETIDGRIATSLANVFRKDDEKKKFDRMMKKIVPGFRDWSLDADDQNDLWLKYKIDSNKFVKIDNAVGGGILAVFSIVHSLVEDGEKVIIIDEPEVFLHPVAQIKLLDVLLNDSKNRQIVFSTHSTLMFKGVPDNVKFISFKNSKKNGKTKTGRVSKFLLPQKTFGEINYFVYNLPTEEFHNELYGYIQYLYETYVSKKNFDEYLSQVNPAEKPDKRKSWKNFKHKCKETDCTLHTYIRHSIHHPENKCGNKDYTNSELKKSISEMIKILNNLTKDLKKQNLI